MSRKALNQISIVTEALFQREYQAIQKILKREASLRQSLAKLEAQSKDAESQYIEDCVMKTIGADFLWQAWVSRTQRQLNIELAQVMAGKIETMTRVRKAFGRNEAIKTLSLTAQLEHQKKLARIQTERLSLFVER